MTQRYFPFDSGAGGSITEASWRDMAALWLSDGVIRGKLNSGAVTQRAAGANKSVDVASLQAWVNGHFFESDATENLTIADNASGNPRIDRIVVRADFTANTITLAVLQGTPAATPVAPALTQSSSTWELSLAQVAVANGFASVADANITDERQYAAGRQDWQHVPATLTYSAADGHTFVATTSADLRNIVSLGARFRCVQVAGVFYGIVTAVAAGSITVYGGTDFTLANAAISRPEFSIAKVPVGFNPDPAKWTEKLTDSTDWTQVPVTGTWYNLGSLSLSVPIGAWRLRASVSLGNSNGERVHAALSTANNSASDSELRRGTFSAATGHEQPVVLEKYLVVAAKTTYYLNAMNPSGTSSISFKGNTGGLTSIRAICAYL